MRKARTNLVLVLLVAAIFFGLANARPDAPPHSVLTALQGIREALVTLNGPEPTAAEPNAVTVEGYCEYLEIAEGGNEAVFTVPLGEQFVLRKLFSASTEAESIHWDLTVNDEIFIPGIINKATRQWGSSGLSGNVYKFEHDFPDNCMVINAGETLKAVNSPSNVSVVLKLMIIGYFRDAQ